MAMQCSFSDFRFIALDSTESTQNLIRQVFETTSQNVLVSAETMSSGVGRTGNKWYAPRGGLWFTGAIKLPKKNPALTIFTGICMHQALQKHYHSKEIKIKWPNDLYVNGKKICGIITTFDARLNAFFIGVGVNTNLKSIPKQIIDIATSCEIEFKKKIENTHILKDFWNIFDQNVGLFLAQGLQSFLPYYKQYDFLTDKEIDVILPNKISSGIYQHLTSQGTIIIKDKKMAEKEIFGGSISVVDKI